MKTFIRLIIILILVSPAVLIITGCAEFGDFFLTPEARIESVELIRADFSSVSLQVNVEIDNPNSTGITLSAYDYRLTVSAQTVVDGRREEPVSLRAEGKSIIPIPVDIGFRELAAVGTSMISDDMIPVERGLGLEITLPYMGTARLDISGSGEIPILRPPIVRPVSMKVERINLTGAELILIMNVENPNGYALTINTAEGRLSVGGREWGVVGTENGAWIPSGKTVVMNVRAHVDFAETGRSAWSLLTGSDNTDIHITGTMDVNMDLPAFDSGGIPWDAAAKVSILPGY